MKNAPVRQWFLVILSLAVSFAAISFARGGDGRSAETSKKSLMVSLGDSLTAATFANAPIPNWTRPLDWPIRTSSSEESERDLLEWIRETLLPDTIVANKRKYSWASGEEIESHFVRLRDWMAVHRPGRSLERLNVSFPGDRTTRLETQARQVAEAMATGAYSELAYVTILIGANDACDNLARTPAQLEVIRRNVLQGLRILNDIPQTTAGNRVPVLLSSLPRVPDVGRTEITDRDTVFGLSCRKVRDEIVRSCNSLTVWNGPRELEERLAIVDGVNRVLKEVTADAARDFPRLDVAYSDALFGKRIEPEEISADCFHPNERGQDAIASTLWADQRWFQ